MHLHFWDIVVLAAYFIVTIAFPMTVEQAETQYQTFVRFSRYPLQPYGRKRSASKQ